MIVTRSQHHVLHIYMKAKTIHTPNITKQSSGLVNQSPLIQSPGSGDSLLMATYSLTAVTTHYFRSWLPTHCNGHSLTPGHSLTTMATHSLPWMATHSLTHCPRTWQLTHCPRSRGHSLTASGPDHSLTAMATHSWPLTHCGHKLTASDPGHSLTHCPRLWQLTALSLLDTHSLLQVLATHSLPWQLTHCSQSPGHSLTAPGPGHSLTAQLPPITVTISAATTHCLHPLFPPHLPLGPPPH